MMGAVASTLIVIEELCVFPTLSVATAVIVWVPSDSGGVVYDQEAVPEAGALAPLSTATATF